MPDLRAVIVAAGRASRLRPMTDEIPKCFLDLGGRPLIDYSLRALKECGIERIAFVVGYLKDQFPERLGDGYEYIFNPFYATTNNMVSLWFAKDFVRGSDFVYLHCDVLYHPDILAMTIASQAEIALVAEERFCDKEMMKIRADGVDFSESGKDIALDEASGDWTGIAKFTDVGWQKYLVEVERLLAEGAFDVYDTAAMNRLVQRERIIQVVSFRGLPFIEIDYPHDLKKARDEIIQSISR